MRAGQTKRYFWIVVTVVAACFSASVLVQNCWHAFKISRRIRQLEREQAVYRDRIAQDSSLLEQLRYDEYLEQYAREHYHMQRRNEHVYIIK
ncbi:MAG: septum formation initiator family protein [Alistipes sp.]|nr:septum formation initiator family protein [Alistipes sp.]MDE6857843.1 septum formation initiator family protein [Alistipes sp.]